MNDQYDLLGTGSAWGGKSYGKGSAFPRCYESHPALPIGEYKVYGGSCSSPKVKDADIYIGFDYSMSFSTGHWPWAKKTEEVYFHITDMQAPDDAAAFKQMIAWAAKQIESGKKLHAGCIGGHGRTGTFLAALVTFMTGELDSITYVRKHYCKKAVESQKQIDFLHKHFSIVKVAGSKSHNTTTFPSKSSSSHVTSKPFSSSAAKSSSKAGSSKSGSRLVDPVSSQKNIWLVPETKV